MTATKSMELRLWIAAALCFVAFFVLGTFVSARTPTRIDVEAIALRGQAVWLAAFFTMLGRGYAIAVAGAVAAGIALAFRANGALIGWLVLSQFLSQGISQASKALFHRTRPDYWLLHREHDFSYPSGHAATAVVFYVALVLLVMRSGELPRPLATFLAAVLMLCAVGIPWSRLALGAHYATDVAGGLLFGAGWLCAAMALAYRFALISPRSIG